MDPDGDGVITIDEFIANYLESEKILRERLADTTAKNNEDKQKRDGVAFKLKESKNERLNTFGVMEGSILTVRVIEARNLLPKDINGLSDPYAILEIEG